MLKPADLQRGFVNLVLAIIRRSLKQWHTHPLRSSYADKLHMTFHRWLTPSPWKTCDVHKDSSHRPGPRHAWKSPNVASLNRVWNMDVLKLCLKNSCKKRKFNQFTISTVVRYLRKLYRIEFNQLKKTLLLSPRVTFRYEKLYYRQP